MTRIVGARRERCDRNGERASGRAGGMSSAVMTFVRFFSGVGRTEPELREEVDDR